MSSPDNHLPIPVEIKIQGIVIPAWLTVCLLIVAVLATFSLLLVYTSTTQQAREIRLLQMHVQDVQSQLIKNGISTRQDFAPSWSLPKTEAGSTETPDAKE